MKSEHDSNVVSDALVLIGAFREHLMQTGCDHCKTIAKKAFRSQTNTSNNTVLGEH